MYAEQFPDELAMLQHEYSRAQGAAKRSIKRQIDGLLAYQAKAQQQAPTQDGAAAAQREEGTPQQPAAGGQTVWDRAVATGDVAPANRDPADQYAQQGAPQASPDPAGRDTRNSGRGADQWSQQGVPQAGPNPGRDMRYPGPQAGPNPGRDMRYPGPQAGPNPGRDMRYPGPQAGRDMRVPPGAPPPMYADPFQDELGFLQSELSRSKGAAQRAIKRQIADLLAFQAGPNPGGPGWAAPQPNEGAPQPPQSRRYPGAPAGSQDPAAAFRFGTQNQGAPVDPAGRDPRLRGPPMGRPGPGPPYPQPSPFPDELSALEFEYSRASGAAKRSIKRQIDELLAYQAAAASAAAERPVSPPPQNDRWAPAPQNDRWEPSPQRAGTPTESAGAESACGVEELDRLEELELELSQAKDASKRAVKDVVKSTQRVLAARVKSLEDAVEGKGLEADRLAKENAALQEELAAAAAQLRDAGGMTTPEQPVGAAAPSFVAPEAPAPAAPVTEEPAGYVPTGATALRSAVDATDTEPFQVRPNSAEAIPTRAEEDCDKGVEEACVEASKEAEAKAAWLKSIRG